VLTASPLSEHITTINIKCQYFTIKNIDIFFQIKQTFLHFPVSYTKKGHTKLVNVYDTNPKLKGCKEVMLLILVLV